MGALILEVLHSSELTQTGVAAVYMLLLASLEILPNPSQLSPVMQARCYRVWVIELACSDHVGVLGWCGAFP